MNQQPTPSPVGENPRLCWKCQALLNSTPPAGVVETETEETRQEPEKKQIRRLKTLELIQTTAENGCLFCLQLLHCLSPPARAALHRYVEAVRHGNRPSSLTHEHGIFLSEGSPPSLSLHLLPDDQTPIPPSDEIKCLFQLFPASEDFESLVNHKPIHDHTDSSSSWALVTSWIKQCREDHKLCNASVPDIPDLPPRVIDVGLSEHDTPRLLVVDEQTTPARYATLSHCWGSEMPLRLLLGNISALEKEIPISQLSKSFQDAILVSRRLGVRYLWIDSLCIIQDSQEDWAKQSASMAQIYSSSYCNIAAAHASDGTHGCFARRDPSLVRPLKVDLAWGPHPGSYYLVPWLYWRSNVQETPLNLRAWVFQENLLARRKIFFGETQLYWECDETVANESFPHGIPPEIDSRNMRDIFRRVHDVWTQREPDEPADLSFDVFGIWDRIVRQFTAANLTYPTDKLVELSGVARKIHDHTRCRYLAGLWRAHLTYQLLWEVRGIQWHVYRSSPGIYIAPSWSWASVNGCVEHSCDVQFADDRDIVLEVLDVDVQLVDSRYPFGQVKGGFLRVKGHLAQSGVHIEESKSNRGAYRLFVNRTPVGSALLDTSNLDEAPSTHWDLYYLAVRSSPSKEPVLHSGPQILSPEISGIILRPTDNATEREFRRVGKFEVFTSRNTFQDACRQFSGANSDNSPGQWGSAVEATIL